MVQVSLKEKGSGFAGEQRVLLPARMSMLAGRQHALLRGLLATGAGYFPKAAGHLRRRAAGAEEGIFIYCVKGQGWCELPGQRLAIEEGDLLVLPAGVPHVYGADRAKPWTIHWAHAVGTELADYLRALGVSARRPLVRVGEDLQMVLLFNEVLVTLQQALTFEHLLRASRALGHILALAIQHQHGSSQDPAEGFQKIGKCIEYMSEHLEQPLKIGALAAVANLSPAHFTVLFKEQTGSSPRDYLHLLRMHRACSWLTATGMALKEIAQRLGYQDQFHFSRKFKAFSGLSPSAYRAAQRLKTIAGT